MATELIHEIIPVGPLQCNCSILGDPITHEALVVDPGDDVERILALLQKHGLKVRAIISTHTHIDHVGGLAQLHAVTGAPVLIHEADMPLYGRLDMQAEFLGVPVPPTTKIDAFVKDGDTVRWGGYTAQILHTPGHTPGSIVLFSDVARRDEVTPGAELGPLVRGVSGASVAPREAQSPLLLAGDTLFQGSIGRTDLWGGSMRDILRSIREKLLVLPEETRVVAGHGDETTIGSEKHENLFLQ
jgi:hydroxyacylglutathione hydrolase